MTIILSFIAVLNKFFQPIGVLALTPWFVENRYVLSKKTMRETILLAVLKEFFSGDRGLKICNLVL